MNKMKWNEKEKEKWTINQAKSTKWNLFIFFENEFENNTNRFIEHKHKRITNGIHEQFTNRKNRFFSLFLLLFEWQKQQDNPYIIIMTWWNEMCWFDLFEVLFEIHSSQWIVQKTSKNSINIHDDDDDDYEVFNYTHTMHIYTLGLYVIDWKGKSKTNLSPSPYINIH